MIKISLSDTVYNCVSNYPQFKDVLIEAGFKKISNPSMLNTVGRVVTIEKGLKMRNISLSHLQEVAKNHGFNIEK